MTNPNAQPSPLTGRGKWRRKTHLASACRRPATSLWAGGAYGGGRYCVRVRLLLCCYLSAALGPTPAHRRDSGKGREEATTRGVVDWRSTARWRGKGRSLFPDHQAQHNMSWGGCNGTKLLWGEPAFAVDGRCRATSS
jgi:hypothetical protein